MGERADILADIVGVKGRQARVRLRGAGPQNIVCAFG